MNTNNPYEMFQTDSDAQAEGVWMKIGTMRFRIAHLSPGNRRIAAIQSRLLRKHGLSAEDLQGDATLSAGPSLQACMTELLTEAVLVDWGSWDAEQNAWSSTIQDQDGNAMAYSKEAAVRLLQDLPELTDRIIKFSQEFTNFRKKQLEDIAGK